MLEFLQVFAVSVAQRSRRLAVAQDTEGSNPSAHPMRP